MVLKTFNIEEKTYKVFSDFCKENGLSMSKQIELFIRAQIEETPKVREEYLKRLNQIKKGNFIKVTDFKKRYLK